MDIVIILMLLLITFLTIKTISDAIDKTSITISPWIESGKYTLPAHIMKKRFNCTDEYTAEIAERYRQLRDVEIRPNHFHWGK